MKIARSDCPGLIPSIGMIALVAVIFSDPLRADNHSGGGYDIQVIAESVPNAIVQDINNRRQVVGFSSTFPGAVTAFLWDNGELELFSALGAELTFANGINDVGIIAGHALDVFNGDALGPHSNTGFLKARDIFVAVNFDSLSSWAFDINNRGNVVGIYCPDDGPTPGCQNDFIESLAAYIMDRSGFRDISPPGAFFAVAASINDRNDAVGTFLDADFNFAGFLMDRHGYYTTIAVPGAFFTDASGINTRGVIVGSYDDAEFVTHGYIRSPDGSFETFDFPGASGTVLTGINDRGDLTGVVVNEFFQPVHSFVAFKRQGNR